jgi:hypothetical protein
MDYKETLNLPKTGFPMKAGIEERQNFVRKLALGIEMDRLAGERARADKEIRVKDDQPDGREQLLQPDNRT